MTGPLVTFSFMIQYHAGDLTSLIIRNEFTNTNVKYYTENTFFRGRAAFSIGTYVKRDVKNVCKVGLTIAPHKRRPDTKSRKYEKEYPSNKSVHTPNGKNNTTSPSSMENGNSRLAVNRASQMAQIGAKATPVFETTPPEV